MYYMRNANKTILFLLEFKSLNTHIPRLAKYLFIRNVTNILLLVILALFANYICNYVTKGIIIVKLLNFIIRRAIIIV